MSEPPLMLDLFAGTGGASAAFRDAGWEVLTADADPRHATMIVADLQSWSWNGRRPTLVWASPPCTEFSRESMPWCRTGAAPDLGLYNAALRIVAECKPEWWVIENVRGAQRWLGRAVMHAGPFYLWGWFPRFDPPRIEPFKESLSGSNQVGRAAVPHSLSLALLRAVEAKRSPLPPGCDCGHSAEAHGVNKVPERGAYWTECSLCSCAGYEACNEPPMPLFAEGA